ncbi:MAG: NYN domain-containing protein [candidate division Zixibacteria bacterium]|nr:NYN domain-containing protein [candidate division Zixibacteria bacterium]
MEKVSLFVDGSNMFYSQRELGWHFEYNKILRHFTKGKELVNAFYYTGYDGDFGSEREDFFKALMRMGFTVRVKKIKSMWDKRANREVVKSNLDIEIVIDMFNTINLYDTAILFSGDGDFERAVELLRSRGRKVIVVAVDTMTALELRNAVGHNFINLREMQEEFEKIRSRANNNQRDYNSDNDRYDDYRDCTKEEQRDSSEADADVKAQSKKNGEKNIKDWVFVRGFNSGYSRNSSSD